MKEHNIAVAIYDQSTKDVTDQIDYNVPDIFNIYDVCDACEENICETCIVRILQTNNYISNNSQLGAL